MKQIIDQVSKEASDRSHIFKWSVMAITYFKRGQAKADFFLLIASRSMDATKFISFIYNLEVDWTL